MASNNQKKAVVYLCPESKSIQFYSLEDNRITHDSVNYRATDFGDEFYKIFTKTLADFSMKYTPASVANTTIVLPDYMVFSDVFSFPTIRNSSQKAYVQRHIAANYKNPKELKINSHIAVKNKQITTCLIIGMRNAMIDAIKRTCLDGRMMAQNITFAANATVNAVNILEPKMKSQTYLLMDVKEHYTRYIYVFSGRAVGFYTLPFGLSVLERDKLAAEDLLLDHPIAELAVLNAKEKAKAKALTMMGGADASAVATAEGETEGEEGAARPAIEMSNSAQTVKSMPKKVARKLPKFMLREPPKTDAEMVYENFRIFEKWALCFIAGNSRLTSLHPPAAVYINLPEKFNFLYDMVNAEEAENGVKFLPVFTKKHEREIESNLEMYGGLFSSKMNTENNF